MSNGAHQQPSFDQSFVWLTLTAFEAQHVTYDALRECFNGFQAVYPSNTLTAAAWFDLGTFMWMYYCSARGKEELRLAQELLHYCRLWHLEASGGSHLDIMAEIEEQYQRAVALQTPGSTRDPQNVSTNQHESPAEGEDWPDEVPYGQTDEADVEGESESDSESDSDGQDHVEKSGGFRELKSNKISFALRGTNAARGASDTVVNGAQLGFECPYRRHASDRRIRFQASRDISAHMRNVHGYSAGWKVVAVDVSKQQYKMAGGTQQAVYWKLVRAD